QSSFSAAAWPSIHIRISVSTGDTSSSLAADGVSADGLAASSLILTSSTAEPSRKRHRYASATSRSVRTRLVDRSAFSACVSPVRSLSLRPNDSLTIPKDGFVDRLPGLSFLPARLSKLQNSDFCSGGVDSH